MRLLDLYCGAGGAAMGYRRAGFEIVGVDIEPQPRFPFTFVQADALEYVATHGQEFDAIHASPPCQAYSRTRFLPWLANRRKLPQLIEPTRLVLTEVGVPWIIENVPDAHLPAGWLCGTMFGLPFFLHRYFEVGGWFCMFPPHAKHRFVMQPGRLFGARLAMSHDAKGLDWMTSHEQVEAIPPAYTEFIGGRLTAQL